MPIQFRDSQEERDLFVEWVLSDVASRRPSGKRQPKPMQAMWMMRPKPKMRGSDITERRYVALKVLTDAGVSMKDAVVIVGAHLGIDTFDDLEVIRTGFYDFTAPVSLNLWRGYFLDWTRWVVQLSAGALYRP